MAAIGGELTVAVGGNVLAVDKDVAAVAVIHAAENVENGCLAGTAVADDNDKFPFFRREGNMIGGNDALCTGRIIFADILHRNKSHTGAPFHCNLLSFYYRRVHFSRVQSRGA